MELHELNIAAQLADMKQIDYHHMLLLSTLIELLVENQIVNREEIVAVMQELDREMSMTIAHDMWPELSRRQSR